jgi:thiol-disulfide isomerase/thioredoxin
MRAVALALVLAPEVACSRGGEDSSFPASTTPVATASTVTTASAVATAPEFANLASLEAALAKQHDHGVLLNFWATWCAPCVAELPGLVETAREFKGRGGELVLVSYDLMIPGVSRDDARTLVTSFVSKRKIEVPVFIYDAEGYDEINARFELPGEVPVTLAIDRHGKIVDRQEGRGDKARWAEMMQRALAP